MNFREPPLLPVGARRLWRCISLLLLPAFAPKAGHSLSRTGATPVLVYETPGPEAVPYLPTVGAPPLRFKRATPPPDLTVRPPAAAPPNPVPPPAEAPAPSSPPAILESPTIAASTPPSSTTTAPNPDPEPPVRETAPAILPDDSRPPVRTEDFLPYFQLPGAGRTPGDVNVIVPGTFTPPASATLPPSSATYTQTPK